MEKLSINPKKFEKCDNPTCAACMYAKSTLAPGSRSSRNIPQKTNPGKIVSVDQLLSSTLGLVAHMNYILTTKGYKYAIVFVDHFSRYSYMHLQYTASFKETVEVKHVFESMLASHGIIIKQYHYGNGIFRAN